MTVVPTQPEFCSGCPLYGKAKGFCLGSGDPTRAKYAMILEAPGSQEIVTRISPNPNRAFLTTQEECDKELATRRRDYPELEDRFLKQSVPIAGPTGAALQFWVFPRLGLRREDFYIDNTIRCLAPRGKNGEQYPKGDERKEAELYCRRYDRLDKFRPDTGIVSIHPASILREITPLPLLVKDFEKLRDFTAQGRKVVMLLGGKSSHAFLRYASNVTKWRGHYTAFPPDWPETYKSLFEFKRKQRRKKVTDDEIQAEFFGVPSGVLERAREKGRRPEELQLGLCKSAKRHTHKRGPKCGYAGCWDEYERRKGVENQQTESASNGGTVAGTGGPGDCAGVRDGETDSKESSSVDILSNRSTE